MSPLIWLAGIIVILYFARAVLIPLALALTLNFLLMPMVLWLDEKQGTYALQAETTGKNGDPKAENLSVDSTLQLAVLNVGVSTPTTFNGLPAIRFLADGTVDENSPQTLQLTDSAGISRWLVQTRSRTGYEIRNTKQ